MRIRAASVLLFAAAALRAQDTGSVAGTVINSLSGAGIPGMNVLLWTKGAQYQATTDDNGDFRVEEMAPGSYRARFEREGFIPFQRDQPPLMVAATGDPARLRVEISPYATLRGRVVDPDSKPAADVEVELRAPRGEAPFSAITGADGAFTFDRLSPGSFLLFAIPKTPSDAPAGEGGRISLVPTYFPSVEERAQAEKILVTAGAGLTGYEIRLRAAPVYRIRGAVVDESGKPAPRATVALISTKEGMSSAPGYTQAGVVLFGILREETETGVTAGDDGRFTFSSVRSGPWRLLARYQSRTSDGSAPLSGAIAASIADHDLDDLQIRLEPLFTLTGTSEFKDDPAREEPRRGGILLTNTDMPASVVTFSKPDGTLRVPDLMPGLYRIEAIPGPVGTDSASSVLMGERQVLGQVVQLSAATPPLRVAYSANTGIVRGSVANGECDRIVLLPNPLVQPMPARTQPCQAGSLFEIAGVAPGQYYVVAFDRMDRTVWPDEAFLRSITQNAPTVQVGQGPAAAVQLTITHWPD